MPAHNSIAARGFSFPLAWLIHREAHVPCVLGVDDGAGLASRLSSTPLLKFLTISQVIWHTLPAGRNGSKFVNEKYLKRLMKFVAELAAIAIAVVLLQLFIGWIGFEAAWPILVGVLVVLVIAIAAMRK